MGYKLYQVYTSRGQLLLTEEADVCAKFMGLDMPSFYSHVQHHREFGTVTSKGYYAIVSSEELEKDITSVAAYTAKKDIIVPQKQKNGLMRLVRIKKGKLYKWDKIVDKGTILLAADIKQKGNIRKYHDVIKLKKIDLDKYFIKKQCC